MRTTANLNALCDALATNCGDIFSACMTVGLSVQFVSQWRRDDADANTAMTEAERFGSMRLESAAIRRAVHGTIEPVFYQGEVCGYKTNYSDGLMQTLLKGKLRHVYGADGEGGQRNVFNGPVQINQMPRADTYEDWLRMKEATLAAREEPKALPAPVQVIEGSYTVREPALEGLGL